MAVDRRVNVAYEAVVSGDVASVHGRPGVRALVADSWERSLRRGLDPDSPRTEVSLTHADLVGERSRSPLAAAMPIVRDLLVDAVADDGLIVALSDDAGRLLWVEGNRRVRDEVGSIGFVEGAVWREDVVGTNAPGTALATGRPVQVVGPEHFTRPVQAYSCAAAPVRDLATGQVLGVLDVTGGAPAASGVMLSLVRASAAAVERELARSDLGGRRPPDARPGLQVLGPVPALRLPGAPTQRLSLRHAELLVLLAEGAEGSTADELAVLLAPGALSDVTVRAEISRLRRVVGPLLDGGRPYRLAVPLATDVADVRARLAADDVAGALHAYTGPVLPRSVAPGVERVRDELEADVRSAVLRSADPAVVERWTGRREGADDHAAWTRLARLSPPGSAARARALGRLALLDRTFGLGGAGGR
ncbi:putative transcriptional regulator [Luteimicrobium album]|uniref:Transcriptional regulator n=1 Tax=Luteimicrobium album TaxID=1054550 RepID=A0ABQ6I0X2_9MICO|nr:GAF domain-containing protein [Luteimicrobium album]GMA24290.1 putative transcriptional regulator [Luteimicrobium album]